MAVGMGNLVMGRGADLDLDSFRQRQKMADQLYASALATPTQPQLSWTQGASRLAQALSAGYEDSKLQRDKDLYRQQKMEDMQLLGSGLANGGDFSSIISQLKDPSSQMMALSLSQGKINQANKIASQKELKAYQSQLDTQRDENKVNIDPAKKNQSQLSDANNALAMLSSAQQQETDPDRQQAIQDKIDRLQAQKEQIVSQIRDSKGAVPDMRKEFANQGYAALAAGANPGSLTPVQAEAMRSISLTPKIEPAFNAKLGQGMADEALGAMKNLSESAEASRDIASKGSQVLQIIAANPNVDGGWGKENITKVQTLFNRILPGAAPDVGDQQALQKLVGQLTPQAVGNLRAEGVQRITQGEIMNLIPKITATMENDREGMKSILELHNAIDVPIQEAKKHLLELKYQYRKDPSFDIETAVNDLQMALRKDVSDASMNYMNNKLAAKGEMLVLNPDYDENNHVLDKYILQPIPQESTQQAGVQPPPPPVESPAATLPPQPQT